MEVVAHSDWDLTGCVALIWLIVSVNTQHLHCRSPPEQNRYKQQWQWTQTPSYKRKKIHANWILPPRNKKPTPVGLKIRPKCLREYSKYPRNPSTEGTQLHVTWTVCWLSEVGIRLTASRSPGCRPSADPLRNLNMGGETEFKLHQTRLVPLYTHGRQYIKFGANLVYRRIGTTQPGSRSPGPSRSAPAASGRRRVVSCSGWPSFNHGERKRHK